MEKNLSRNVSGLSFHVHGIQRLAGSHKQPVSFGASKTKIAASFREKYLPDPLSIRRENVDAVVARAGPTGA